VPPRAKDCTARRRLALVPGPRDVEPPGRISFVSAQARWGVDGRSKAIPSAATISQSTVQDHVKAIYEKTGVRRRPEVVTLVPAGAWSA
jgi:hypothetical protein